MRALLASIFAVALLASLGSASASASATITLTMSSATAVVNQPWRYTVSVQDASGAPVRARLKLQLLVGTRVVGCFRGGAVARCAGSAAGDWIPLRGKWSHAIRFPQRTLGARLTFQAVVQALGQTRKLRASLRVRSAAP
jgi:hypothetical protein